MVTVHLTVLALTVVIILIADKQGLSWMRGKKEMINPKILHTLHVLMWVGLGLMITTGAIMASEYWEFLITDPAFRIKMVFVGALIINGLFIGGLSQVATTTPFRDLSMARKLPLFISGMVSFVGWIGAFIAANLMNI